MSEETKSYVQMRDEFLAGLRKQCFPILSSMENRRKKLQAIFKILLPIGAISLIFFILFMVAPSAMTNSVDGTASNNSNFYVIFSLIFNVFAPFAIVPATLIATAYFFCSKRFENDLKKQVMPVLCKALENIEWSQNPIMSHDIYVNSRILNSRFDRVQVDDVFTGEYKNVKYNIVEAQYSKKVVHRTEKGSTTRYETIFNGLLITLDMNKNFNCHTLIKSNILGRFMATKELKHTTLEDVEFEKKYDVLTNDEVEARYLITPSFMERLNNVKTSFLAHNIECAFYQDKLIIAMDSLPDMFHIGSLWKPLSDEAQYFKMFEEILSIIKLIDHFKLDQKIGL